jgi:AMMECR1 domain-containing protein
MRWGIPTLRQFFLVVGIERGQIGKHGMILEFTDPESVRRSATYLPEIAAQEGVQKSGTQFCLST